MNQPTKTTQKQPTQTARAMNLEGEAIELHQLAHNALAAAAWHVARGESALAMSRIRRAQAHLAHASSERGAS